MAVKILIIEDEAAIREMVEMSLTAAGFQVFQAESGEEGFSLLNEHVPDLILLDWMLPGMSGIDFARRIKKDPLCSDIPVIMLTARGEEEDKVRGLDSGADDFVTKPFSPRELISRIKAVLRRAAPMSSEEVVEVDGLRLDPLSHRVTANDRNLDMGPTEFRLLHFFMTHQERVFTRGQLLDNVWGTNVYVEERTVDVHIRRLRKAIADSGHDRLVQTVRGAGYRFSAKP
ncbi:MAG: phosphate regulon transcriptional regulator PhoB [Ectothiorhodospiraceae bacterium]|nr:phosphate regulon transcriptional regulator PhoB [Ectothiorhodospiraceae bacterium]